MAAFSLLLDKQKYPWIAEQVAPHSPESGSIHEAQHTPVYGSFEEVPPALRGRPYPEETPDQFAARIRNGWLQMNLRRSALAQAVEVPQSDQERESIRHFRAVWAQVSRESHGRIPPPPTGTHRTEDE